MNIYSLLFSFAVFLVLIFWKTDNKKEKKAKTSKRSIIKHYLIPDTSWLVECGSKDINLLLNRIVYSYSLNKDEIYSIKIHKMVLNELKGLEKDPVKSEYVKRVFKFLREIKERFYNVEISDFGLEHPYEKFKTSDLSTTDAIVLSLAEKLLKENNNKDKVEITVLATDKALINTGRKNKINTTDWGLIYTKKKDLFEEDENFIEKMHKETIDYLLYISDD